MVHGVDARSCLRGDDPAVTMGDHDGWLFTRSQYLPDRGDILGQPRSFSTSRLTRLAAARQGGCLAGDAPLGQQLTSSMPPPRSILDACPMHKNRLSCRVGGDSSVREVDLDAGAAEVDHRYQGVW